MNILIIGGTRNLGHFLAHTLIARGDRVTVLNRGRTPDELPEAVERLHADRTDHKAFAAAVKGRIFDAVIDNALFKEAEARASVEVLHGHVGRFIFLSSGQVYLVREGSPRPSRESDYDGLMMPAPKVGTFGYEEWLYGMDKRAVENTMAQAWRDKGFPYTSLRLPMVNSERDHFFRLYNYILRLKDGGGILAPVTPNYALRHVYGADVISAILRLLDTGKGIGRAYNISQDETVSLDEFLGIVADLLGTEARILRMPYTRLEAQGFLPDCSPFSERWMSEPDNTLSKTDLGMRYTPLREALANLVARYESSPPPPPASYRRRRAEINYIKNAPPDSE